jgi:hypothetical protein
MPTNSGILALPVNTNFGSVMEFHWDSLLVLEELKVYLDRPVDNQLT